MKNATKSKTLWTFGTTLAGAVTALALHYLGVLELGPAELGAAVSSGVTGVVGIALRLITTGPVTIGGAS